MKVAVRAVSARLGYWRRLWRTTAPSASKRRKYYRAMCDRYAAELKALKCR